MAAAKLYTVVSAVARFGPGDVLQLDEAQALSRMAVLEATAGGLYCARGPMEFKRGEQIGLPADVPKRLAAALQPVPTAARKQSVRSAAPAAAPAAADGAG